MSEPQTKPATPRHDWLPLVAFILVTFGASAIGSLTGTGTTDWYKTIAKPSWTPPGWLFGPVWTALYFSIGIAGWMVWRGRGFKKTRAAMALFALQLALNATWTPIFFGLQAPWAAFAVIVALWLAIIGTILAFRHHDRRAAWLLIPYLLWVSFAATLNVGIARLN